MARKEEFVTFFSPGTAFAERTTLPIKSWDTKIAVKMAAGIVERYDATPYGFRFETHITAEPVPDGEGGLLAVTSKVTKKSGVHFLGGQLRTLDDVEARNDPKESILRSNMRSFPIVCEVRGKYLSTQPFEEEDFLVNRDGEIIQRGDDPVHVAYRKRKNDELGR